MAKLNFMGASMATKTIYLLVPDANGKIQGSSGRLFSVASDPEKTTLNTKTEAWTDNPKIANNPACLATLETEADEEE